VQLLRGRLSQVHDAAHDASHRRHVPRQRRTVHDGAQGAVSGHGMPVQSTRVMGRHVSMQTAPLQVRLHRQHIFFPVRVQLGRLYNNTATKQRAVTTTTTTTTTTHATSTARRRCLPARSLQLYHGNTKQHM